MERAYPSLACVVLICPAWKIDTRERVAFSGELTRVATQVQYVKLYAKRRMKTRESNAVNACPLTVNLSTL